MKRLNIISILILSAITFFLGCKPETKKLASSNGKISIKNMLTPSGEKLLPAEEGPFLSVFGLPVIDTNTFKLEISGLVDSSFSLTWNEIRDMPAAYSDTILMYCVEGWEVWGKWKGIKVNDLLSKAHVQLGGNYILFSTFDGYTTSLPVSYLVKYNALLAYNVNGSPLKGSDGFPLRLIAFGKYGYKWAKWVTKLEVINQSQLGYWESLGYSDQADVPISRRSYYEGPNTMPLEY